MNDIAFTKVSGLGNDFILIDDRDERIKPTTTWVQRLCDRHFGIGADGVMLIRRPHDPRNDVAWWFINNDGSIPEMCGNGSRCLARFVYENGLLPEGQRTVRLETLAGVKTIAIATDDAGNFTGATVDMGAARTAAADVPTTLPQGACGRVMCKPLEVAGRTVFVSAVSMGNPHAVINRADLDFEVDDVLFSELGPALECHPAFPEKTNVEFIRIDSEHELTMRVWERGVGETLACGTGACASAVVAQMNGWCDSDVIVHLKGGDLHIVITDETVYMTGPATHVFDGTVHATMEE